MDVFKSLDEFIKKDFNKTTLVKINNSNYLFPYNYIDNNFITDSSLNKYYKHCIKNHSSIIHDNKVFEMIEQLNNKKAFEQLRSEREKEKEKLYQNLFKDNNENEIEEYNNINLNNFIEKLSDKKNNEDQGYNIMYLFMQLLKNRCKKINRKKKYQNMKVFFQRKNNVFVQGIENQENNGNKKEKSLNENNNDLFGIKISRSDKDLYRNNSNFILNKKEQTKNRWFNILKNKDHINNNDFLSVEKKLFNVFDIHKYKNKRKSFQIEKSNNLIRMNNSFLNNNNYKSITNNPADLFKLKIYKKINKKSFISPKKYNNTLTSISNSEKIQNKNNNRLLKEKEYNKNFNSLIIENKSTNRTTYEGSGILNIKKRNPKLLKELKLKEKEINDKAQELSHLINTSYKNKEKIKYDIEKNKILNKEKNKTYDFIKGKEVEYIHKKNNKLTKINKYKIAQNQSKKIECNINNIIYENKGKYNLAITNKYIFGITNKKSDIIDNIKKNIVYELKKQLINKCSYDLLKINQKDIIKKINKRFRINNNNIYKSFSK